MDSEKIYNIMRELDEYFKIDGDFVSVKTSVYEQSQLVRALLEIVTNTKDQTLLIKDLNTYTRVIESQKQGLLDCDIAVLLVQNQVSTGEGSVDLVYGDVLWANTEGYEHIVLVFNWLDHIYLQ